MNERILELRTQAAAWVAENHQPQDPNAYSQKEIDQRYLMYEEKFAELMIVEFMDVVKTTANELNEHYFRQGCSEEEVLMRVNGALAVLGHIRERFKD